jgi:hypothetical protein
MRGGAHVSHDNLEAWYLCCQQGHLFGKSQIGVPRWDQDGDFSLGDSLHQRQNLRMVRQRAGADWVEEKTLEPECVYRKGQPSERLLTVAGVQPSKRDEPIREALRGLLQDLMNLWVGSRKVEQRGHHSLVYVTSIHGGDQFIGCLGMIPIRVPAKVNVKIDHKLVGHSVAIVLTVQYTRIDKGDLALRQLGSDEHFGGDDGSLDRTDHWPRQGPA